MKISLFIIVGLFCGSALAQDTNCSPDGLGGFRCSTSPSLQQQIGGGVDLMSFQRGAELGEAHRQNEMLRQQMLQQQMQQQSIQQAPQQQTPQPMPGGVQRHRIALPQQTDIAQAQAPDIQIANQPGLLAAVVFDGDQAMCVYKPAARTHFGVNGMALSTVRVTQIGTCGQRMLLNADGNARTK